MYIQQKNQSNWEGLILCRTVQGVEYPSDILLIIEAIVDNTLYP